MKDSFNHPEPDDTILETERLVLRFQRRGDIESLVDLWTDPKATAYMGGPRDREAMRTEFTRVAAEPRAETFDLWPVMLKNGGTFAGYCGLIPKDIEGAEETELVYVFRADCWGKGYAREMAAAIRDFAFSTWDIPRLVALIDPENLASVKVATAAGFVPEREVVRPGGKTKVLYTVSRPV